MGFTKRGMSIPEYLKWRTRVMDELMPALRVFCAEQEVLGPNRRQGQAFINALKSVIGAKGITLDEFKAEVRSWEEWMST